MPIPLQIKTLPTLVKIFVAWLYLVSFFLGMLLLFLFTTSSFSYFFVVVCCLLLVISVLPIIDFYNKSPRAILTSQTAIIIFSVLLLFFSIGMYFIENPTSLPQKYLADLEKASVSLNTSFFWLIGMSFVFSVALLISFCVYLQRSVAVKNYLGILVANPVTRALSIGQGSLATLSFTSVAMTIWLYLALFFSQNSYGENSLFCIALITLPYVIAPMAILFSLRAPIVNARLFLRIAFWLCCVLVTIASRYFITDSIKSMMLENLQWSLFVYLYVLPDALIIALPIIWWNLSIQANKLPSEQQEPRSAIIKLATELPPPLTISLAYIAFLTLLFSFGGVTPSQLSGSRLFQKEHIEVTSYIFQVAPFRLLMLVWGIYCIRYTFSHPLRGIKFCRIYCLATLALLFLFAFSLLALKVPLVIAARPALTDISFFIFTTLLCYVALTVIQNILLIPKEVAQTGRNALPEVSDFKDGAASHSNYPKSNFFYLEKVRSSLPKWIESFCPQPSQPLTIYFFYIFCLAVIMKWAIPCFIESLTLRSTLENTPTGYISLLNFIAFTGVFFPVLALSFMKKATNFLRLMRFLFIWAVAITFLGIYPVLPGFSVLAPEAIAIFAMIAYLKESTSDSEQSKEQKRTFL